MVGTLVSEQGALVLLGICTDRLPGNADHVLSFCLTVRYARCWCTVPGKLKTQPRWGDASPQLDTQGSPEHMEFDAY